ncbi:MAG TPA: protein kinase [Vicinamibacterales bacterium]|nr:protein kinase [Vicinamibacterales bacterium]
MHLTFGARVGHYEVVELLGAGAMGEVYRAHDPKLGRHVAIKLLNVVTALKADDVRRLEREARAASALNHPGIVTIHDTGESAGRFFIVMEFIDGTTLRHFLRRGALPLKRALQIASQLADALAKAHEVGIVHRDLKPENVMVSSDGHVKIVDFGLAKLGEPALAGSSNAGEATIGDGSSRGMLLGTVGYMSPEQASGNTADFRSDQFAFGAILYELVTGTRAFQRTTSVETLSMIVTSEPERPLALNPALPVPLVWTIERCLSKDAADRYASTRDLAREIQTFRDHMGELTAVARPPHAVARRGAVLAAAAVAVAIGVAAYLAWPSSGSGASAVASGLAFTQLTFGRGHVANARFAPDGQTIFYAAGWNGAPLQVFETRPSGPESRPLGPASTSLASISSTGELALILGCRLDWGNCVGTLARMPPGGAPREILEDVISADWAPDGESLAAIQLAAGEYQLHFPPGKPLYTTEGRLGYVRFSPHGDRLAFVEHEVVDDETGVLKIIDLQGQATTVSGRWEKIRDVVWSPAGGEIWVTASRQGNTTSIYAVSLSGEQRVILHAPGAITVLDLAPDRRALIAHGLSRAHIVWSSGTDTRELSWLDWSTVADLSSDGKTILFYEWGQAVGRNPEVYLRTIDEADAVRLGDGRALALSPDERWALALREMPQPHLVLLPTGAGTSRTLPPEGLTDFYWARWFPDGQRLLVVGAGPDALPASFIQDTATGRLEPVAEKGMLAVLVSPDGRRLLISDPLAGYLMWPLDGGPPVELEGLDAEDRPVQWSADGRFLYVRGAEEPVVRMYRFEIATGEKDLVTELAPRDPSGVVGVADGRGQLAVTPDGKSYVFTYWTWMRDLFLVEGLFR